MRHAGLRRIVTVVLLACLLLGVAPDAAAARTPRWLKRLGNVAERIVNAPGRVATWATKWAGPTVGPIAATLLAGHLASNSKVAKILSKANKVRQVTEDVKFLDQSVHDLRKVYTDEASEYDRLAQEMETVMREAQAEGETFEGLQDLYRLKISYKLVSASLRDRARSIGVDDIIELLGKDLLKRLAAHGENVVMGELSRELQRLLGADVMTVLSRGGLNPELVVQRILEHDAERVLAAEGEGLDSDLKERLKERLREMLRADRDFFKKNWRAEVQRLIAEARRRREGERVAVSRGPTQSPEATKPPDVSATESPTDDTSADDEEPADQTAPSTVAPQPKAPAPAAPDKWVVWYAAEVGYKPLVISTEADFERPTPGHSFPGGGLGEEPIRKTQAGGPFATRDDARRWLSGQLSDHGYLSGVYAGMYVAKFRGEIHNLELLGYDPKTPP